MCQRLPEQTQHGTDHFFSVPAGNGHEQAHHLAHQEHEGHQKTQQLDVHTQTLARPQHAHQRPLTLGTWLLGLPAPLALGVIAGLLEFVPVLGPVVAALPGVLLAMTISPRPKSASIALLSARLVQPSASGWLAN